MTKGRSFWTNKLFSKWISIVAIVLFSICLRLWNLNAVGRTWDEYAYVNTGYTFIELIEKKNFTDSSWYEISDHPPIARYFYGIAASYDRIVTDATHDIWYFPYDWTTARYVSVLFSSLTVIFIILLGWEEISPFVGIISGIIFIMLPILLGLSQLVTLESPLVFFFTGTLYFFIQYLKKNTRRNIVITGIFLGLAIGVKLTNLLVIPLLPALYVVWNSHHRKKLTKKSMILALLGIYILAFAIVYATWPGTWLHTNDILENTLRTRFPNNMQRAHELFFGSNIPVPLYYFFAYFLLTTPLLILIFFLWGIFHIFTAKKKRWIKYMCVIWFFFPFIQSFYPQSINGIRYLIEIYAPLSLIAAIGFDSLVNKISKKTEIKIALFLPVFGYLFFVLLQISPYYLNYFNSIVGGPKGVYESKLFPLGWWGEGQKEAAKYIFTHSVPTTQVGLALIPQYVYPFESRHITYFENTVDAKKQLSSKKYDYVVVNYLFIIRTHFDDKLLAKNYNLVYSVLANKAPIVKVYKHK